MVDRDKERIDDNFTSENREIHHFLRCHVQRERNSYPSIGYSHDDLALGFPIPRRTFLLHAFRTRTESVYTVCCADTRTAESAAGVDKTTLPLDT